jgi:hypothetical protein
VQRAAETLAPEERARAVVIGRSFGEAGSLGFLGPARALAIAKTDDRRRRWYREVTPVTTVGCRFCTSFLQGATIYACRGLRVSREQLWAEAKHYQ